MTLTPKGAQAWLNSCLGAVSNGFRAKPNVADVMNTRSNSVNCTDRVPTSCRSSSSSRDGSRLELQGCGKLHMAWLQIGQCRCQACSALTQWQVHQGLTIDIQQVKDEDTHMHGNLQGKQPRVTVRTDASWVKCVYMPCVAVLLSLIDVVVQLHGIAVQLTAPMVQSSKPYALDTC